MSYFDRLDWHYQNEGFLKDTPQENAATHIGIYLAWVINNGLVGEFHIAESKSSLERVKRREITGRDFLISECDSKLGGDDVNDEGYEFTDFYYQGVIDGASLFLFDYAEMFIKEPMNFYDVEDTWENYDKLSPVINERFRSWKAVRKIFEERKL